MMNNRIAVANSRATGAAKPPAFINHGSSTELIMNADFTPRKDPTAAISDRASWDFSVKANLIHCAGVRMRILVQNPQNVSHFNIYLQFGSTWYAAPFTPTRNNAWETIYIPKTSFFPEGNPESWSHCSIMRISAWKGTNANAIIHLAELEFVRPNANFALLRSGTTAAVLKEKLSYKYAEILGNALTSTGLHPAVIEDADCQTLHLKPYAFAFVPFQSAASPPQQTAIANMIQRGSKVAVFHELLPIIAAQMDMPSSRFMRAQDLPNYNNGQAYLKYIIPIPQKLPGANAFLHSTNSFIGVTTDLQQLDVTAWWYDSMNNRTNWPAVIQNKHGFWMTHVFQADDFKRSVPFLLAQTAIFMPDIKQIAAQTKLAEAHQAYQDANATQQAQAVEALSTAYRHFQTKQYDLALIYAALTIKNLNTPVALRPAPKNEFRAVWINSLGGLPNANWNSTMALLKQARFNAVFPFTASPYAANFTTTILPRQPFQPAFEDCMTAARANGIQVHAWLNCLNVTEAPENIRESLKNEGRLQMDIFGKTIYWLCPSNPKNRSHLVNIVQNVASSFPTAGIHLDMIRFNSSQTCVCPTCRTYFEKYIQHPVAHWPADILQTGQLRNEWLAFRQLAITSLVTDCVTTARSQNPNAVVSAAVFPDLNIAQKTVAQNWPEWFGQNGVNFICPMDYQSSTILFDADIKRQINELQSRSKMIPGIGVSSKQLSLDEVKRQINATREANLPGFILFKLGPREANDILPYLN
ncbi:MAG: family 10 glycosylhydrolase [Victivallales bacterium]|nr:family 10 glycosylhydrolase [Victivallales bacterium]